MTRYCTFYPFLQSTSPLKQTNLTSRKYLYAMMEDDEYVQIVFKYLAAYCIEKHCN